MVCRVGGVDYTGYNSVTIVEPAVSESAMTPACVLYVRTELRMYALN